MFWPGLLGDDPITVEDEVDAAEAVNKDEALDGELGGVPEEEEEPEAVEFNQLAQGGGFGSCLIEMDLDCFE